MIVNIAGTSGSGKSTLVRNAIQCFPEYNVVQLFREGRRQPYGYAMRESTGHQPLVVLGHYEGNAGGGVDNLDDYDQIFSLVRYWHQRGANILFEGLLVSAEFPRTLQLHQDRFPLRVIALDVPLDVCLRQINQRRCEKNPYATEVNPRRTVEKANAIQSRLRRLEQAGVRVDRLPWQAALDAVRSEVLNQSSKAVA
jgi:thymidylate kinase